MAWQGSAPALPVETEVVVQEVRGRNDTVTTRSARGQLDRQRDAIESGADAGNDRRILFAELEGWPARRGPLHEELPGGELPHVAGLHARLRRRARQWRQPECVLALDPQRLAARREDVHVGGLAEERFCAA